MITHIELTDFRNYRQQAIDFSGGVTAIIGDNAQGKTSLVEAMTYLATLKSFKGLPNDALIRHGADSAYIRATIVHEDGRELLVEAEINRAGRNRVLVNKQRLARSRDLLGVVRTTVFAPDDLDIVKEGPSGRRDLMDDALVALNIRNDALRLEVDRVVRQRNVLLKQSGGKLTDEIATTLQVWDQKFVQSGSQLGEARAYLVAQLNPYVAEAYESLAGEATPVELVYEPEWRRTGLAAALEAARTEDLRRGSSTVGPHHDDLGLWLKGMSAKAHASQGEQRTLALALRLATHRLVTEKVGTPPVLILDDVLSELDPHRCAALLNQVPPGQTFITTAAVLPPAAHPNAIVTISNGTVVSVQHVEQKN